MALGLNTVNLADKILNHLRGGTAWTQPASLWVKLHTADPGAAGATAAATLATRSQATFAASSGGIMSLTGTQPSWSSSSTETISHISVWDASTAGNVLWSASLGTAKSIQPGDTLTLTSCTLGFNLSLMA